MQTPSPTPAWPSYLSFHFESNIEFLAFNDDPEGIWFTFPGTRLVLTSIDGLKSYGAMPKYVNYTSGQTANYELWPEQDSMYIPDQYCAKIEFWQLQSPVRSIGNPCGACEVPSGDWSGPHKVRTLFA